MQGVRGGYEAQVNSVTDQTSLIGDNWTPCLQVVAGRTRPDPSNGCTATAAPDASGCGRQTADSGGEKDFGKGGGGLDFLARPEEVEGGRTASPIGGVRHQWPGPAAAYLRPPAKNVPAPKDVDHVMEQLQRMEQELASKKSELRNKRESTPPEKRHRRRSSALPVTDVSMPACRAVLCRDT